LSFAWGGGEKPLTQAFGRLSRRGREFACLLPPGEGAPKGRMRELLQEVGAFLSWSLGTSKGDENFNESLV
jgi:hypothetical protein